MSKLEGGGDPIDPPPSRLRVTIFFSRLLGLIVAKTSEFQTYLQHEPLDGGTHYILMIRMIVAFFSDCNQQFSILRGCSSEIYLKNKTDIC